MRAISVSDAINQSEDRKINDQEGQPTKNKIGILDDFDDRIVFLRICDIRD